jgi:hypothetical protein
VVDVNHLRRGGPSNNKNQRCKQPTQRMERQRMEYTPPEEFSAARADGAGLHYGN